MDAEKRYQVFVSSTYLDLVEERQEVMHALLELDCMPSGMELLPAANETQWSLIKKVIDDCDYYIVIVAGRYGSIGPEGLSYTEMEYRYAASQAKPIIAFVHRDPGKILSENCETTDDGKRRLADFRTLVEQKLCKQWSSAAELGSVVSRSLIQLMRSTQAVGWVRADELPDKNAALELLKLRHQVDELEAELARARVTPPRGTEDLAHGDEIRELHYSFRDWNQPYERGGHSDTFPATWNGLFRAIAPAMINEASEQSLMHILDSFVAEANRARLEKREDFLGHELSLFSLNMEDFQTIKVQLRALGLIAKSAKPHGVKDTDTYWTLTPYGDEMMTRLRAIRRTPPTGLEVDSGSTG
ncbi:DUF4062 domain-containing protein [Candidatus Cryosericum septentrionale]|jgi:hypothetical protein|uniref:DUF4062 domain-containing protein n=1 Tax=Candidatus Cryosericum septentrionale TaxID=2290913 RepID=A0A398DLN9_9BACT|nr:DUF4062 domain-containing protein [Candidatus Cryosericum septentrionale]RIE16502.1 DUF4062 domain-containing protein [Candidatus Cryosericum septentrionale]